MTDATDDGLDDLRTLMRMVGVEEANDASLSEPVELSRLLAGLEARLRVIQDSGLGGLLSPALRDLNEARDRLAERIAVTQEAAGDRTTVWARVADIDARIAALQAEGFSQANVTRIARLIEERDPLVRRMVRPGDRQTGGAQAGGPHPTHGADGNSEDDAGNNAEVSKEHHMPSGELSKE